MMSNEQEQRSTQGTANTQGDNSGQNVGANSGAANQYNYNVAGDVYNINNPPNSGQSAAPRGTQKAQAILTLEGDIQDFTEEEREAFKWSLARLLNISPDEIRILRVTEGSIKVELALPEEAAQKLEEMYRDNDPALQELPNSVLNVKTDTYNTLLLDVLRTGTKLAHTLASASVLDSDIQKFIHASAPHSTRDLDRAQALDRARILASDLASDLASANALALASDRALTRARILANALASASDLASDLASLTSDLDSLASDLASANALALASDLDSDLASALVSAFGLFKHLLNTASTWPEPNSPEVVAFQQAVEKFVEQSIASRQERDQTLEEKNTSQTEESKRNPEG
jgi:hypothetical protein